jgi:TonB family protein
MQRAITKKLMHNSFLLSVIFHLLLLLFLLWMSTVITFNREENIQKSPELYIPSYVYKGAITPPVQHSAANNLSQSHEVPPAQTIQPAQAKSSALASEPKNISGKQNNLFQKSILGMSRSLIQQNQVSTALNNMNDSEPPILLVGDKHAIVDPLIKLVGRSLSANFHYPRIEGTFGARGRVYVELVLHPEGYFSDVQIVQSSEIQDFDAAALYAVNKAPTVVGVDKFLPRPKRFIVGFIFE